MTNNIVGLKSSRTRILAALLFIAILGTFAVGFQNCAPMSAMSTSNSSSGSTSPNASLNISQFQYASKSLNVQHQDSNPHAFVLSADGKKLYMSGTANLSVFQYDLPVAWNLSGASYSGKSLLVAAQENDGGGISFNADGKILYLAGDRSNKVWEYGLSQPWDVSTAVYNGKSFDLRNQSTRICGPSFSADGMAMFVNDCSGTVFQYALATAWDVSTATYANESLDTRCNGTAAAAVFSSDGRLLLCTNFAEASVYAYKLSTPWKLSSAINTPMSYNISRQDSFAHAIFVSGDSTQMYVLGFSGSSSIFQYSSAEPVPNVPPLDPALGSSLNPSPSPSPSSPSATPASSESDWSMTIYISSLKGQYLFSASAHEGTAAGFVDLGKAAWLLRSTPDMTTVPVYRCFSAQNGDHYLTAKGCVSSSDFREPAMGYSSNISDGGMHLVELKRYLNPTTGMRYASTSAGEAYGLGFTRPEDSLGYVAIPIPTASPSPSPSPNSKALFTMTYSLSPFVFTRGRYSEFLPDQSFVAGQTCSTRGMPDGLSLNSTDGKIYGIPNTTGVYSTTIICPVTDTAQVQIVVK